MWTKEKVYIFLSTPSARRATFCKDGEVSAEWISIHALREEGDRVRHQFSGLFQISIHALREEGDAGCSLSGCYKVISIHALREEGDSR